MLTKIMKITEVEEFALSFKRENAPRRGVGQPIKKDTVIVRVKTEDGIVGYGEAHHALAPTLVADLVNQNLSALIVLGAHVKAHDRSRRMEAGHREKFLERGIHERTANAAVHGQGQRSAQALFGGVGVGEIDCLKTNNSRYAAPIRPEQPEGNSYAATGIYSRPRRGRLC